MRILEDLLHNMLCMRQEIEYAVARLENPHETGIASSLLLHNHFNNLLARIGKVFGYIYTFQGPIARTFYVE